MISREEDESEVETLKEIITRFSKELCEEELKFYPEPMIGQNIFDALEDGLRSSQYTFVFLGDGSQEDGWMLFQQNVALMQRVGDHSKYIVPVKSHSNTPIPRFLQVYHVLEISTLLKGKRIDGVEAKSLTEDDINVSLMKLLVNAISSQAEKLVTKICVPFDCNA